MARGVWRAAFTGAVLCIVVAVTCPSRATTSDPPAVLETAIEEGSVDFGEMNPGSSPRTLRDAVYIAVKPQRFGPWNLTVAATGDFSAGDGGPTFPIASLEVAARLDGQPAPFQKCGTTPVTLVAGGPETGGTVAMDYRLSVGYDVPATAPGALYRSSLVYTTSYGLLAASYVDPNPFNPLIHRVVAIKYYYSPTPYPYVYVRIHDPQGTVVYVRAFPKPPEGWYVETWNGKDTDGRLVPDGVYSYSIIASTYIIAGGYIRVQSSLQGSSTQRCADDRPRTHLQLSACACPASAAIGDVVTFTASLRNVGPFDLANGRVTFDLPGGLRPLPGTGAADDGRGRRPVGMAAAATGVSWDLATLEREVPVTLAFKAAVGPDARPGAAAARARASGTFGRLMVRSAEVSIPIVIEQRALAGPGAIAGRVFTDRDTDGEMDETDQPAGGVVVAVDTAGQARSDANGRFVIDGLSPGDHALSVEARSLPSGWRPRQATIIVSIAPGEVVRLDVPLHRMEGEAHGAGTQRSPLLSGTGVVKVEASPGHTSWQAEGQVEVRARGGFEIGLAASTGTGGAATGEPTASGPAPKLQGQALLTTPVGNNARLVLGLSAGAGASPQAPAVSVGMEVAPLHGLMMTGGYDTSAGSAWMSGSWERRLTDALTFSAGGRISGRVRKPDGGRGAAGEGAAAIALVPQMCLTYRGPSQVTGRLALVGAPRPAAELACSLPLARSLILSLTHRRTLGDATPDLRSSPADGTVIGLYYSPGDGARLTAGAECQPDGGKLGGILRLAGNTSGGGSYSVALRASLEPRREAVSLRMGASLPKHLDSLVMLACDGERRRGDAGIIGRRLSTTLSCSVVLDEHTSASALVSLKHVDDNSPPAPASVVTQAVAAHLNRRMAPGLSVGAGGSWVYQDPGGATVVSAQAEAAYDLAPQARLVFGYRATLASTQVPPVGVPWTSGPYLRVILAPGWGLTVPELHGFR